MHRFRFRFHSVCRVGLDVAPLVQYLARAYAVVGGVTAPVGWVQQVRCVVHVDNTVIVRNTLNRAY
jgi:hypothetical protein